MLDADACRLSKVDMENSHQYQFYPVHEFWGNTCYEKKFDNLSHMVLSLPLKTRIG